MRLLTVTTAAILAPAVGIAAPAQEGYLIARENLCSLKSPPVLCQPNPATTVEETAKRAYQFYRAFVVDGDPRLMFSLIDNVYKVRLHARPKRRIAENAAATQSWVPGWASGHLAVVLRRPQDRKRVQHVLVLRRQHKHVVRFLRHCRPMEVGRWLRPRARKYIGPLTQRRDTEPYHFAVGLERENAGQGQVLQASRLRSVSRLVSGKMAQVDGLKGFVTELTIPTRPLFHMGRIMGL